MGGRSYDPSIGRWLSEDPIQSSEPMSLNFYAYVSNNPLILTDPTGTGDWAGGGGPRTTQDQVKDWITAFGEDTQSQFAAWRADLQQRGVAALPQGETPAVPSAAAIAREIPLAAPVVTAVRPSSSLPDLPSGHDFMIVSAHRLCHARLLLQRAQIA